MNLNVSIKGINVSMIIIDIAGLKKSGKTTVIENLIRELSSRGFRVGTVKKIHIPNFSIDQPGKDTYRHKSAGAEFVISLAPNEIALMKKNDGKRDLDEILDLIPEDIDFLICEELNEIRDEIFYIITLKNINELEETLKVRAIGKNVLAISGVVSSMISNHDKYPVFNVIDQDGRTKLVDLLISKKNINT